MVAEERLLQTSLALGAGEGHTVVLHVLRSPGQRSKPRTASARQALVPAVPRPSPGSAKSHLLSQPQLRVKGGSQRRREAPPTRSPAPQHTPPPSGFRGEGTWPGLTGWQHLACWGGVGLQDTFLYFKERHVPLPGLRSPLRQQGGGAEGPGLSSTLGTVGGPAWGKRGEGGLESALRKESQEMGCLCLPVFVDLKHWMG